MQPDATPERLREIGLLFHDARSRSRRRNHMTSRFQLAPVWSITPSLRAEGI
jgi:hypothetical protein